MASDYQFISTDTDTLAAALVAGYEEITGVTVQPASPEKLFILWAADIIIQTRALINYAANQNIPSRASGENLDALAELFYQGSRPAATAAQCTVRFYLSAAQSSAVLIPAGTRVADANSTLFWETLEDVYVAIGDTYADATVQCQTAGVDGNGYTAGQLNVLVDVFTYYASCENITESDGGGDAATDAEFLEILQQSQSAYSVAGPVGAYEYWAKSVSTEIADVAAVSPEPGEVVIYAVMNDGTIASDTIKALILDACSADDVRPLTDSVSVADPDTVTFDVELTYYISASTSRAAADVEADVAAAVAEYESWQSGHLGRDVNPSKLISMLMAVDGVKRVDVASPAFADLSDGSDGSAPEMAELGTETVTNGGYEDD
ncbi:MAG: baseplate J/gp47 family protein [Oscillospiraceae bacterium]|nr:baseplate J/gp47 family protein [Oscillospiraceae bacterium]